MSTSKQLVSVDEYDRMIASGQLTENDRVELIRGEIIEKMPIGDPHSGCVNFLGERLREVLGSAAGVHVQNPVRLPDSEPEPDIAVVERRSDFYRTGKPRPKDVFLIVEVADSSLDFDRETKGPMYAEAGIREYWIVNLIDECIEVFRNPKAGVYLDVRNVARGETLELLAFPKSMLTADEILG